MVSMATAITTALESVPNPGSSRSGIQRRSTKTLTTNVANPTLRPDCTEMPCARTVHGLTPRPAAMNIASPVPKSQRPAKSAAAVDPLGLKVSGASALQSVRGTLWAGRSRRRQSAKSIHPSRSLQDPPQLRGMIQDRLNLSNRTLSRHAGAMTGTEMIR